MEIEKLIEKFVLGDIDFKRMNTKKLTYCMDATLLLKEELKYRLKELNIIDNFEVTVDGNKIYIREKDSE